jgi:hypothetical protein
MSEQATDDRWSRWSAELYHSWERGMTAWWDRVLDAPEVLDALNETLSGQVRTRSAARAAGQRWMERMNLPTRDDLTRLARIATLLEEKLLSMEDQLLAMRDHLGTVEKEAVRARIEAAETRLALTERLVALEARLAAREAGDAR